MRRRAYVITHARSENLQLNILNFLGKDIV